MRAKFLTIIVATTALVSACSEANINSPSTDIVVKTPVQAKTMQARTKAVLVYADWCGSCKVLDPKIKTVKAMGDIAGLEYVTLDYTNKMSNDFFAQAEASNIGVAVKAYFPDGKIKTGQLLLVDIDDQKVIGKVTKSLEAPEIVTALKDAVAAS